MEIVTNICFKEKYLDFNKQNYFFIELYFLLAL